MAPVSGPCISEPTLCVGFCIALESVGAIAGHGPAGKKTPHSEARGTAWGLHAPKTPKEEVALAKTGKNAWRDCFSCRFGGAPLTIRGCPNPRELIFLVAHKAGENPAALP